MLLVSPCYAHAMYQWRGPGTTARSCGGVVQPQRCLLRALAEGQGCGNENWMTGTFIYREPLYLGFGHIMVSCRCYLKPIHWQYLAKHTFCVGSILMLNGLIKSQFLWSSPNFWMPRLRRSLPPPSASGNHGIRIPLVGFLPQPGTAGKLRFAWDRMGICGGDCYRIMRISYCSNRINVVCTWGFQRRSGYADVDGRTCRGYISNLGCFLHPTHTNHFWHVMRNGLWF